MDRYIQELIAGLFGLILIVAGLIWPSVFMRTLGYIFFIAILFMVVGRLVLKKVLGTYDEEYVLNVGCWPWMIMTGVLTFLFICNRDFTYISSSNDQQHIYEDCETITNNDAKRVREIDAFLLGKRKTCTICIEREKLIRKERHERKIQSEREKMIKALYESIKDLEHGDTPEDIIERLIQDFDFDVVSYCKDCGYEVYE